VPNTPHDTPLSLPAQAVIALMCAVSFFYAFKLNAYWFSQFEFSDGANWVFIPSGLRMLLVLVLVRTGAIGIVIGSIAINYDLSSVPGSHMFNIVTGLISGAAPFVARAVAQSWLHLDTHLSNLNARFLFKISVLFAATNALLHQLWFFWIGHTQDFIASTFAMVVGDWLGTVLVLAAANLGIQVVKLRLCSKP
jgi:hypothetical protein